MTKILIPQGTYRLTRATFLGPCKAPIEFQLVGTLQAPSSASGFKDGDGWVTFERIDKLTVYGGGVFDGNGKASWGKHCTRLSYCSKLPIVSSYYTYPFDLSTKGLINYFSHPKTLLFASHKKMHVLFVL